MSTAIAKNFQVGNDSTATNNFTIRQPATPDGTVRIANGNSGTTTDLVTVTSAGNVGVGTSSPGAKLDVQGGRSYFASNSDAFAAYLRYNNSTAGVFLGSPSANAFQISNSGGGAYLNIDSSGNLNVGGSSAQSGKITAFLNFGNSWASNYTARALGTAQGQLAGYSFNPTFQATADNGPRRAADIWSGFNGGAWGTEFLAFGVGTGAGAANDAGNVTTERMRITVSGNVGIGTSSPVGRLDVVNSTTPYVNITATGGTTAAVLCLNATSGSAEAITYQQALRFGSATGANAAGFTERARITSGGDLLVGRTSTLNTKFLVEGQAAIGSAGAGGNGIYLYVSGALSDNSYLSRASAGTGTTTWYIGNQTITTSSDVRLKDNIKPTERNALELLQQWEIVDHTWNDPSDQCENNRNSRGVWTGVVAQQVQSITPWLVNKPLEDVNEDGSINPWTMDFGYAVPLLVKAIQELNAKVESLTTELNTLKGS